MDDVLDTVDVAGPRAYIILTEISLVRAASWVHRGDVDGTGGVGSSSWVLRCRPVPTWAAECVPARKSARMVPDLPIAISALSLCLCVVCVRCCVADLAQRGISNLFLLLLFRLIN